jgi:glyoxylase-like metal-dependent hydrolase (beta-lactamase superfamily II)
MRRDVVVLSCLLALPSVVRGHSGAPPPGRPADPPPAVRVERVADGVFCLSGRGGKVGVVVTGAGVVVVDDQYDDTAPALLEAIRSLSDRPIRWLINTHFHGDHTGGNRVFAPIADIVAQHRVRARLLEDPEVVRRTFPPRIAALQQEIEGLDDPADPWRAALEKDLGLLRFLLEGAGVEHGEPAVPVLTYGDTVTVWPGGREVRVFHVGPAHTDGDSIVHVPDRGVLHVGDLMFHGSVPFLDVRGGGSALGLIAGLDRAIASVPPGTSVIPGHGSVTDVAALRRYREFLAAVRDEVQQAVAAGRTKPETVRLVRVGGYDDIRPGFRTLGNLVAALYDEIRAP